jgi:hypothetical protein
MKRFKEKLRPRVIPVKATARGWRFSAAALLPLAGLRPLAARAGA